MLSSYFMQKLMESGCDSVTHWYSKVRIEHWAHQEDEIKLCNMYITIRSICLNMNNCCVLLTTIVTTGH